MSLGESCFNGGCTYPCRRSGRHAALHRGAPRAYIRPCFLVRFRMANEVKRKPATPQLQGFNWKGFLIKSAIAIALFNVIAGLVTCYFILPGPTH
jgi:hypothetical protein